MEYRFMMPALPFMYYLCQEGLRKLYVTLVATGAPSRVAQVLGGVSLFIAAAGTFAPTFGYKHDSRFGWEIRKLVISTKIQERTGDWLKRYSAPGESIAVSGGGVAPYRSGLYAVELHGLTDANIAHAPLTRRGMVGHERWATWDYLKEKQVTYVLADRGLETFTSQPLYREDVVSVKRDEGTYLNFKTFRRIAEFRLELIRRGATVSLPDERKMLFDFENGTYDGWERSGQAFGLSPATGAFPGQ